VVDSGHSVHTNSLAADEELRRGNICPAGFSVSHLRFCMRTVCLRRGGVRWTTRQDWRGTLSAVTGRTDLSAEQELVVGNRGGERRPKACSSGLSLLRERDIGGGGTGGSGRTVFEADCGVGGGDLKCLSSRSTAVQFPVYIAAAGVKQARPGPQRARSTT